MIHFCFKLPAEKKTVFKAFSFKQYFKSWSVVFFGSDNFSMYSLKGLHKQMRENKLIRSLEVVVTNNETVVYKYAVSNNIKVHIWPPNFNKSFDFGVIASFGKLIPKNIIDQFPLGIFNVHASILPKYRGGMPIVHALKNGEISTGVTVSRIVHDKFDVGEIILQKSCIIGEDEVFPSLCKKLAVLGFECILEVIKTLPDCLKNSFPQCGKDASYAPIVKKDAAVVKWNEMTALEIFNLHRALFGKFELITTWRDLSVKLCCLSLYKSHYSTVDLSSEKLQPGRFIYDKKTQFLYVQCKDEPIIVCSIKINHKILNAFNFHRGYLHRHPKTAWKFKS